MASSSSRQTLAARRGREGFRPSPARTAISVSSIEDGLMEIEAWKSSRRINITNDMSFIDFAGSGQEFKHLGGVALTDNERVLIDNLWVAQKNGAVATINALTHVLMLSQKEKYYALYTGSVPGVYKTWDEIVALTKEGKHRFQKKSCELLI